MIISDENSKPIIIDSINNPIVSDYFWVLDLQDIDFRLTKFLVNEEIHTPSLALNILGYVIELPTSWNILVYSEETSQLDIVSVSEVTRGDFIALVFDHKNNKILPGQISAIAYNNYSPIHTPSLNKAQMLCHALGPDCWVIVSPTDSYNKYLKNCIAGDLLS
jgi:hypothetical protein